ncbi:hypothetical protein MJO29_014757 [Puccinia striiformis f. sp. tritici]
MKKVSPNALEEERDNPLELDYLHQLIYSQFEISPIEPSLEDAQFPPSTPIAEPVLPNPSLEENNGKVAFKLFSGQSKLQIINIAEKKVEPEREESPPVVYIPVERILDVADEPKNVRKLRRKQIVSVATDREGIQEMAKQITKKCDRKLPSYRATNPGFYDEGSLAILDDLRNPAPQMISNSIIDGIKYPKRRTQPILTKPQVSSNKTDKRKRRRERKRYRAAVNNQSSSKIVTLAYL